MESDDLHRVGHVVSHGELAVESCWPQKTECRKLF